MYNSVITKIKVVSFLYSNTLSPVEKFTYGTVFDWFPMQNLILERLSFIQLFWSHHGKIPKFGLLKYAASALETNEIHRRVKSMT